MLNSELLKLKSQNLIMKELKDETIENVRPKDLSLNASDSICQKKNGHKKNQLSKEKNLENFSKNILLLKNNSINTNCKIFVETTRIKVFDMKQKDRSFSVNKINNKTFYKKDLKTNFLDITPKSHSII